MAWKCQRNGSLNHERKGKESTKMTAKIFYIAHENDSNSQYQYNDCVDWKDKDFSCLSSILLFIPEKSLSFQSTQSVSI